MGDVSGRSIIHRLMTAIVPTLVSDYLLNMPRSTSYVLALGYTLGDSCIHPSFTNPVVTHVYRTLLVCQVDRVVREAHVALFHVKVHLGGERTKKTWNRL